MTNKEIGIQMALGTIEPQNLSHEEFDHWIILVCQRGARNMKENEERRLRAAGQEDSDSNND